MTTSLKFIDPKYPDEKLVLTFNLANGLAPGETLNGTPVATITCTYGGDASPAAMANGALSINATQTTDRAGNVYPAGTLVYVPVQGGVDGCDYVIEVNCPTTNALKTLSLAAILSVRT